MDKITASFTVLFENPFWIGIYERTENGNLTVCRIVFGSEPKDYEVYDYLSKNWSKLAFSPPVAACCTNAGKTNPKRMQRQIKRQTLNNGIGTKAQQAIKLQQEQQKLQKKSVRRFQKEEEKQIKFELRQNKKKEKHRGR